MADYVTYRLVLRNRQVRLVHAVSCVITSSGFLTFKDGENRPLLSVRPELWAWLERVFKDSSPWSTLLPDDKAPELDRDDPFERIVVEPPTEPNA